MIGNVIRLLQTDKWYKVSKEVEIAKGRFQYIDTTKKAARQLKRIIKSNYYEKV